jgi:hypothetical protein
VHGALQQQQPHHVTLAMHAQTKAMLYNVRETNRFCITNVQLWHPVRSIVTACRQTVRPRCIATTRQAPAGDQPALQQGVIFPRRLLLLLLKLYKAQRQHI